MILKDKLKENFIVNRKLEIEAKCEPFEKFQFKEPLLNFPELYLSAEKMYLVVKDYPKISKWLRENKKVFFTVGQEFDILIPKYEKIDGIDLECIRESSIFELFIKAYERYLPSISKPYLKGLAYKIAKAMKEPEYDLDRLFYMIEVLEKNTSTFYNVENYKDIKVVSSRGLDEVLKELPAISNPHGLKIEIKDAKDVQGDLKDFRDAIENRLNELMACARHVEATIDLISRISSEAYIKEVNKAKDDIYNKELISIMQSLADYVGNQVKEYKKDITGFANLRLLQVLENYYGVYEDLTKLPIKVKNILDIGLPKPEMKQQVISDSKQASTRITHLNSWLKYFNQVITLEKNRLEYVDYLLSKGYIDKNLYYRFIMEGEI